MKNKCLITSALPYVNGPLHIGHLIGCLLPSDVYARFCRARGDDVLYVCGDDEHGTPSIVGAMKQGKTIQEYNDFFRAEHLIDIKNFDLSFDLYGRTHTELQTKLVQSLFTRWDEMGLIQERVMRQPFSIDDNMFLADRQIKGTCPKCGHDAADGDQCEKCGALLNPTDLINPYSAISGSHNIEIRETKHLFFLYSKMEPKIRKWINSRKGWPKTAITIANKWLDEGLLDTPITRDLPWGIPVNKPGYEDKVFYVWFDAPWGYVSISQATTDNWESWWKDPNCRYTEFMGKDNVSFHSILFPAQELALDDNWKTVDVLKALNFLNFEGNKISKSKGNGIFLSDAINEAPSDAWRYALISSAPETDDNNFTIQRFAEIVNKDLNGILGNFVSRVIKLTNKNFGDIVPKSDNKLPEIKDLDKNINEKLAELTDALSSCEFRHSIVALRDIWALGNEFLAKSEPWAMVKNGDTHGAGAILNECFQLIDLYARISMPFIPNAANTIHKVFVTDNKNIDSSWPSKFEKRITDGQKFIIPENLFSKIEDTQIADMVEKYAKNKNFTYEK